MIERESHVERLHRKLKERNRHKTTLPSFTQTIENEFTHSWDWVKGLYQAHPCREKVWRFLAEMREKGYDKTLRAGQSMWKLMLSRSISHGLRPDQPYVYFYFSEEGMSFGFGNDKEEVFNSEVKLTPQIEEMLQKLLLNIVD